VNNKGLAAGAEREPQEELLAWENLGAQPAVRAFRHSLTDLILRPGRFFRAMALTGGLHEPVAFFAVVLMAGIALAFPAALACVGLAAGDPDAAPSASYKALVFAARATGLMLVALPLTALVLSAAMVLLGSLFHAGGKAFGLRNWEGSVSIWLYAGAAALVPLVAAAGAILAVSLAGYLLSIPWPGARATALPVAQWTARVLVPAALLTGSVLFVLDTLVGCARAFRLEAIVGIAAGVSGLVLPAAALGTIAWCVEAQRTVAGLMAAGAALCLAAGTVLGGVIASRRGEEGA
jgi:hypothetical protein